MKNINIKILIQSLLIVVGFIFVSAGLALLLTSISQQTLFGILGLGAFGLLWYISYDILSYIKNQK